MSSHYIVYQYVGIDMPVPYHRHVSEIMLYPYRRLRGLTSSKPAQEWARLIIFMNFFSEKFGL